MKFFLWILTIICIYYLLVLLLFLLRRIIMCLKLKNECNKNGLSITSAHPLWFLGCKKGNSCDLFIDTNEKVYSIKLFPVNNRRSILFFDGHRNFFIRKSLGLIANTGARAVLHKDSLHRKIPNYNFKKNYCEKWYLKDLIPVLLIHPCRHDVMYQTTDPQKYRPIYPGESINGMMIMQLDDLLHKIGEKDYDHTQIDKS